MPDHPSVEDTTQRFAEVGFTLHVDQRPDGTWFATAIPGPDRHLGGPVGEGRTDREAAYAAWAQFDQNRAAYLREGPGR